MWSKSFKAGDGKIKRDVAMSAQVLMSVHKILRIISGRVDPKEKGRDRGQIGRRRKAEHGTGEC